MSEDQEECDIEEMESKVTRSITKGRDKKKINAKIRK